MPDISHRAQQMPASPIRKLVPYAEDAIKRGVKVYHLNIGQPDISTPREMMDVYRHHHLSVLEYSHSGGIWEYRENLVRYYKKYDIQISPEEILITTGGSEAIIFAMMAVMDSGDEFITPEPFYTNYNGFAQEVGVRLVPVTCYAENGFKLPPGDEIRKKISPRTRAILICNPNNPTGYVYTWNELQLLRDLSLEYGLFFLSDEVYREFVYDDARYFSVMHLEGMENQAILLDSVSKRFSACGARVGCLITRNREVIEAVLRFGQARLSSPTLDQMAANAALDTPETYFSEVVGEYQQRRDVVFEALSKIPGVVGLKPKGAFYTIVKLPVDDAEKFCIWLLKDFQDRGETVMLAPGNGFYATPGLGMDEVRIAFVLNAPAMKRSMEILSKALEEYPGLR